MTRGQAVMVHPAAVESAWLDSARLHTITPPRAAYVRPHRKTNPALRSIAQYRAYLDTLDEAFPVLEWGLRWCELKAPSSEGMGAGGRSSQAEWTYRQVMAHLRRAVIALQQAPAMAPQEPLADEVNRVRRKLANAIRDGLFDAPGERQEVLLATLAQIVRTRLALSGKTSENKHDCGKETL